ncbi:MAG: helix-turn-helix domain-containing protein [Treponema sp.]|jgi:transcriptional regulator with XRE-family HTH domain|nr:helix-turn-helix domain-containing protein [Treponema sp.]
MGGDELRATLARNIKLYRGLRDWSQADLSEKAGLSVVYLSDIERGNKWPYLDTLVKLAEAFEVEAFELLQPKNSQPPDETAAILVKYSEETLAILTASLETMKKHTFNSLISLRAQYLPKKPKKLAAYPSMRLENSMLAELREGYK